MSLGVKTWAHIILKISVKIFFIVNLIAYFYTTPINLSV